MYRSALKAGGREKIKLTHVICARRGGSGDEEQYDNMSEKAHRIFNVSV